MTKFQSPNYNWLFKQQVWWSRKKSGNTSFCHSGESRNPVFSNGYKFPGFPFSREWRLFTRPASFGDCKLEFIWLLVLGNWCL